MKQWISGMALVLALGLPVAAAAQAAVGVRGGVRWSELDTSQDAGSLDALVLGGYFGFGVSDRLALQIEAVYGTRGAGALRVGTDDLDPSATPARLEMTYLEVPLLLRMGFPGERFLPTLFLGPYTGFLLGCDLTPEGGESRPCDEEGATARFSPRSTDFGVLVGAGLDMALGESTVFIDGRLTLGLLSIESGDNAFDAGQVGAAISAGFAVPLGR